MTTLQYSKKEASQNQRESFIIRDVRVRVLTTATANIIAEYL
jgi:hypothetical protein